MGRSKAPSLPIKALSFCRPTELRGKGGGASHQRGKTPKWYVKYMTRCFSPQIPRFPLRGSPAKRERVYKAERRFDTPSLSCPPIGGLCHFCFLPLYPPRSANTKKRRPFKGAVLLPLFGYFCRNYFCFFFTGRFLRNLVNTDGEKGNQVEKDEGIGQGIVAFGNEVDNADFGEGY